MSAALALLALAAPHAAPAATPPAAISFRARGAAVRVPVKLDPAAVDPAGEHSTSLLGLRGRLALVLDSYATRPQPLSRCKAGHERYVRLVDVKTRRERWSRLAESCLNDVTAADPPATWDADGRGFTVHLTSTPAVHARLAADGSVTTP